MKKELFLHIGTQKTGSSAIQVFLTQNQKSLLKTGLEYLDPCANKFGLFNMNHSGLVLALTGFWRGDSPQLSKEDAWFMLREKVEQSKHSVIISSEGFSTPEVSQHMGFIKDSLSGFNVKIVIYLRRQDIYAQSLYKEQIKDREHRPFELAYEEAGYEKFLDYKNIVDQWGNAFGKQNILVRPYEKGQLKNGDIVADFMQTIGVKINNKMLRVDKPVNKTMNDHVLQISRELNALGIHGPEINEFKWWLNSILEDDPGDVFVDHDLIESARRLEILNAFSEGNRYIAREYLNRSDGILFFDDLPQGTALVNSGSGIPAKSVARIISKVFERSDLLESFANQHKNN